VNRNLVCVVLFSIFGLAASIGVGLVEEMNNPKSGPTAAEAPSAAVPQLARK